MDAAFASHALTEAECARIAATGQLQLTVDDMKKQFYIKSIEDMYGPGLLVLRKYADDDDEELASTKAHLSEPTKRATSWFRPTKHTNVRENTAIETTPAKQPWTSGLVSAFVTPIKARSAFMASAANFDEVSNQEQHSVQNLTLSTVVTETSTSCSMHVVTSSTTTLASYVDSYQSPVGSATHKHTRLECASQEFTTPKPTSRAVTSGRVLHVQLPETISNESTPLPSRVGVPDSFGISPVIADNKKRAAALQVKKRQFEAATPVKPAMTTEAIDPADDQDDDGEVDIVLRHEEPVDRPRRWSTPDFFKRFRSSDIEPIVDAAAYTTPTKTLDDLLDIPSESSSIWDRLKAIRMPDILAEGLAFSSHASTNPLENHDDLYDDNNDADDLCCGFDLMNVDHEDDSHAIEISNEEAESSSERPMTLDFTLTPMTACHHTTHERRSSSRVRSPPTTALPVATTSTRRRTRNQRKKRLARGVSMSNVARCGESTPPPTTARGCTDSCHQWGRFSTCGRMHGRWTPPPSSIAGNAI